MANWYRRAGTADEATRHDHSGSPKNASAPEVGYDGRLRSSNPLNQHATWFQLANIWSPTSAITFRRVVLTCPSESLRVE